MYNVKYDVDWPFLIEIGDDVTITNSTLLTHDASTQNIFHKSRIGHIVIGNNVFVGYGSIILPNVTIGDNVVIGAGSVVTRDIPPNCIAAGNPCRVVGEYDKFVQKNTAAIQNSEEHAVVDAYRSKDARVWDEVRNKMKNSWGYN